MYRVLLRKRLAALSSIVFENTEKLNAYSLKQRLAAVMSASEAECKTIKLCKDGDRFCRGDLFEMIEEAHRYYLNEFTNDRVILPNESASTKQVAIKAIKFESDLFLYYLSSECNQGEASVSADAFPSDDSEDQNDFNAIPSGALFFQLSSINDVKECLARFDKPGGRVSSAIKVALNELVKSNGALELVELDPHYDEKLNTLSTDFPHMKPLIEMIESNMDLMSLSSEVTPLFLLPGPVVLDGPPGIGKTFIAETIGKLFNTGYSVIGGAEITNSFDITGMSAGWGTGQPGLISKLLIEKRNANPIIVLDEIDKMENRGSNMSPTAALYSLFELESAKRFKDEFLDLTFDASKINWICTSNYVDQIPAPIRDRVQILSIPAPSLSQRLLIVKHLYVRMREDNVWGKSFVPSLNEDAALRLAVAGSESLRVLKRLLHKCFTLVAHNRKHKKVEGQLGFSSDVLDEALRILDNDSLKMKKNTIGFIH